MSMYTRVSLLAAMAAAAAAQPRITEVRNHAGNIPPGMPNHAIARGAIMALRGSGLAAEGGLSQDPVLDRNLGGVSVRVTVGGAATMAIPYSVSPGLIVAILPSATPEGDGSVTVAYNGQTSPPAPVRVVTSAFGIATIDESGGGVAAAFDADSKPITFTASAN